MSIVKKYEFPNESKANEYIDLLGFEIDENGIKNPTHDNGIVKIGNFVSVEGTYDDYGNELTPPVLYDKYCVDVYWMDSVRVLDEETQQENSLPYDLWQDYEITIDDEGIHSFYGVKYIQE